MGFWCKFGNDGGSENGERGVMSGGMMDAASETAECPSCGGRQFTHKFEKKGRQFWRCDACRLMRQDPLPSLEELKAYYDRSYSDGLYDVFVKEKAMKDMTARRRLSEIRRWIRPGRLLDVGCSNGTFLEVAQGEGLAAAGIDLSDVAVEKAREKGLTAHCATISEHRPDELYDTLTAFDVLEHVLDPAGFLLDCARLLKPGGRLALTLPNEASLMAKAMGKAWYFYIPEEHLHYFRPANMGPILAKAGFSLETCSRTYKPMTYDYALTQFEEYNPGIFRVLNTVGHVLPRALKSWVLPLYIGEMKVVATKR